MNAITITPSRLPMDKALAKEYSISAPEWRVLVDQIFPSAKTIESVLMALSYCKSRNLDIFKKPVHIVPMWSSAKGQMVETVWPGISEIRTTAARTGQYVGIDQIEFGPNIDRTFAGTIDKWENRQKTQINITVDLTYPEWAKATVYRLIKGNRCPFTAVVYWEETYATMGSKSDIPNAMWQRRSRGQLSKCAEVAAIRMAFPEEVGNDLSAEEMEGQTLLVEHQEDAPVSKEVALISKKPPAPPTDDEIVVEEEDQVEATEEVEQDSPKDILEEFAQWMINSSTREDVETAWDQFEHHQETLPEADGITLRELYEKAVERVTEADEPEEPTEETNSDDDVSPDEDAVETDERPPNPSSEDSASSTPSDEMDEEHKGKLINLVKDLVKAIDGRGSTSIAAVKEKHKAIVAEFDMDLPDNITLVANQINQDFWSVFDNMDNPKKGMSRSNVLSKYSGAFDMPIGVFTK